MKKLISFMLALCLLFSSVSFGVLAADTNSEEYMQAQALVANSQTEKVTTKHIRQVADNLEKLGKTPFSDDMAKFSVVGLTADNNILYEMEVVEGLSAVIFVTETDEGSIVVDITENDLHNVMTFAENRIFLDGNEVEIDTTIADVQSTKKINPTSRSVAYNTFTLSPQYGSASDYVNYTGTKTSTQVDLGVKWVNATTTAVINILQAALAVSGLLGVGMEILNVVSVWAIQQGAKIPNQDAYMSYKYDTYVPSTQPGSSLHWKLVAKFYAQPNCNGSYYNRVFYENYYY